MWGFWPSAAEWASESVWASAAVCGFSPSLWASAAVWGSSASVWGFSPLMLALDLVGSSRGDPDGVGVELVGVWMRIEWVELDFLI